MINKRQHPFVKIKLNHNNLISFNDNAEGLPKGKADAVLYLDSSRGEAFGSVACGIPIRKIKEHR